MRFISTVPINLAKYSNSLLHPRLSPPTSHRLRQVNKFS